nr:MAG TPA: hypothetical protein [Caudoviricetes sp.]
MSPLRFPTWDCPPIPVERAFSFPLSHCWRVCGA